MIKDIHLKKDLFLVLTIGPLPSIDKEVCFSSLLSLSLSPKEFLYQISPLNQFQNVGEDKENQSHNIFFSFCIYSVYIYLEVYIYEEHILQ